MNELEAERAILRALEEGRVHGKYRCPRCGMRSNDRKEAAECCKALDPSASKRLSDGRFRRLE